MLALLGLLKAESAWSVMLLASPAYAVMGTTTVLLYLSNVGAAKQGLVRMPNLTGTTPSRIGFRGIEDLGNGLKGIFMLENGFAPDSGALNQGGRLFGRVSYVGLSGQLSADSDSSRRVYRASFSCISCIKASP
ncbi:Outer membrane porin protein 32 precursor; putative 3-hydroxyphenylpropionic acid porine [Collimonas fungivorans Ter331]|uniref:Outer membrane porin protein 32 putative 3-hydroxyphenylpropionic acid porine n=1 Tax=Collimonas fungivorans (strain Ter331) TaxID=1005048 RepID=G0ADJ6_COLFT|nr:Outer membrane porin protein 32 precursor; putative 3-hydroxyphenylpropionic acid porine [Collimonas fungivorans Ter331]